MKKIAPIIFFMMTVGFSIASNPNDLIKENETIGYSDNVQTVSDAIKAILDNSGYHLASYKSQDQYAQAVLSQKLNPTQRQRINGSIQREILGLVGDNFDIVINNANKSVLLKIKKSLAKRDSVNNKVSNQNTSVLDQYFKLQNYQTRVAEPLLAALTANPTKKELIAYSKNHQLSFSFNDTDNIVAIASSSKEANALAHKIPEVFFTISGDTLAQTISRWAKKAGYRSYYLAKKDFVIDVPNAFYGALNAKDGALAQLISSATQAGVDIKAQFNANKVLVIKDNSYSPILLGEIMNKKILSLGVLTALVISSCAMPDIKATKTDIKNVKTKSNSLSDQMNTPLSRDYISYSNKPFLGDKSFVIKAQAKPLPEMFNQSISLHSTSNADISQYISKLSNLTGININISNEALEWLYGDSSNGSSISSTSKSSSSTNSDDTSYPTKQIINYSGNLKGYLDELTNRFGLSWKYNYSTKRITIFHTETETFKLAIPESQIDDSTSITNTDANNKSNVSYTTKSADAFAEAINTIKSFDSSIKVSANNSYAMITVTATPRLMSEVSSYVKHFNQEAKKGVQVKIAIYEVKTTKSSNYGIDWNLVYNGTHTQIDWDTTGLGEALSDTNMTTATIKYGIAGGMWAGSNIVASALQKYLDATYVQGFNFYSLNGQSTPLNNGQSQAYVKNLSVTTLGAGAVITADNVQTSVEQATVNTGFTGSVLSNVIGDKIFLRMSLNMSKLLEMQKIEYGNKDYPSTIELPHTESNKIIQNIMLKSGQTAVITGFLEDDNELGQSSLADKKWWLLGGNQGTQGTKETLVVIVSAYEIGDN